MNKSQKILIVDDDETSRTLLHGILHDYTNTYEVSDGVEALAFLHRNPDTALVLLDVVMPKMDGLEVLTRMRLSPYLTDTPVLVLSAATELDLHIRALKLGATEFASKPYQSPLLRQRVANLLQIPRGQVKVDPDSFDEQMYRQSQSLDTGITVYEMGRDRKLQTIYFSDNYVRLCGYKASEYQALLEEGSALQRTIHVDDALAFQQAMETLSADRQPFCQNFRIQRKDGSIHPVTVYANFFSKSPEQTVFCVLTVPVDESFSGIPSARLPIGEGAIDNLTGIPNRGAFLKLTRQMLDERPGEKFLLGVFNIDRFKVVNDLFGTKVGDNILIHLAGRLREDILGRGTFGRLGSDSFAFCVAESTFDLHRLLRQETGLSDVFGLHYNLTIHNGLYAVTEPNLDIAQMCDRARIALASVKSNYIQRYAYYDESMRQEMLAEQQILNDMHQALEHGDFLLYIQPVYSLNFNKPVSGEALVRWNHNGSLIAPGQFIPLFEKNRFITNLDHYMWEHACRYIASRKEQNLSPIPISVNVSRANLFNPGLVNDLEALLKKYDVSSSLLRLEITETTYMDNPQQLIAATRALQKAGFKILIDDFGSGYSSLNMLKDIPLDILKIDMKFIDDLETSSRAAAILLGVIRIAQSLGMTTVAEGVETKFQLDFLRTAGCDNIQGYFYSPPLPVAEFTKLLKNPPMAP
ncbi:MAG: EAL domain-containing protein [Schwartzia sp.]|nr:EAL domain-containing protein [Schwartzia sp. (in: firmicutes)]